MQKKEKKKRKNKTKLRVNVVNIAFANELIYNPM